MKRLLLIPPLILIFALAAVLVWRGFQGREPAMAPVLTFGRPGVAEVRNAIGAETVRIYDQTDRLVARAPVFERPIVEMRFPWKPGGVYRVVTDQGRQSSARAPETVPKFAVRLHAPLGQAPREFDFGRPDTPYPRQRIAVPAKPGETIDVMLEVEKLTDAEPIEFRVSSEIEEAASTGLRMEPVIADEEATLELEFDKRVWTSRVHLGDRLPGKPLSIKLEGGEFSLLLDLVFVSRQLDEDSLSVVRWRLPTEETGFHERQRVADRISIPNPLWVKIAPWFNIRPETPSYSKPIAYQTLWIRNQTAQPVSLLLTSEVLDPDTREPVDFFASPELESTGGTKRILAYSHIDAGATEPCVLPVYVRPDTREGTYLRRVEIKPLGSDATLATLEAPLGIGRSNLLFSGWVFGAAVLSLAWLAATFFLYRPIVRSLGIRLLVLLALLGSLQFCLQFVGGLVSMVLSAVLGPFNCLVGGLLTEVMTYLLVTSILFLVPRVGAMTLAGLVTYVMGGILFGSFGLTDVLFVGSSIAFRELLLLGFGVTRFRAPEGREPPKLLAMILALGLADAASTFTSLALQAVFFRLFFADWYIFLQVVVTGFLYTSLGVYLGKSLGVSLRKVQT